MQTSVIFLGTIYQIRQRNFLLYCLDLARIGNLDYLNSMMYFLLMYVLHATYNAKEQVSW